MGQRAEVTTDSDATTGDFAAFEALMRGRERDVFAYLWRLTGDEQTAYDLCQETFLRAWQRFATVRRYEQPGAWLFRVATNLALNALKQRKELTYLGVDQLGDGATAAALDLVEDPARRYEVRDLIHRTLLRLQPRHRSALVLREVYGLSSLEVAAALGTTNAAAKMALSRAREEFRRRLAYEEGRP
jgi:RNA polymerase sigma-70 factor (ECF subfamily)